MSACRGQFDPWGTRRLATLIKEVSWGEIGEIEHLLAVKHAERARKLAKMDRDIKRQEAMLKHGSISAARIAEPSLFHPEPPPGGKAP